MLRTRPISIQHAVNRPTVKHAGSANRCHTWRCWPQVEKQIYPPSAAPDPHLHYHPVRPPKPQIFRTPATCRPYEGAYLPLGWVTSVNLPVTVLYERNQSGDILTCSCFPSRSLTCLFCCECSCWHDNKLLYLVNALQRGCRGEATGGYRDHLPKFVGWHNHLCCWGICLRDTTL